jgi:hypothetical protein
MYQIPLMSSGTAIYRNPLFRGRSDVSAQRPSAFYLVAITLLLPSAAAVLHNEQNYPLLVNIDQIWPTAIKKLSPSSMATTTKLGSKFMQKFQNIGELHITHVDMYIV